MTLTLTAGAVGPQEGLPPEPDLDLQTGLDLQGFGDTSGHVFANDIDWLADSGITRGCNPPDNTLFCPDDHVTRGQMAAFLHRALPGLVTLQPSAFSDAAGDVFEADILWIAAVGISKGCNPPDNTLFCPDDYVTRGQMAAFLSRALNLPAGSAYFVDTADHLFAEDISRLAAAEITRGCDPPDNTRFCPDERVTRGQMAAFLSRALSVPPDAPDPEGDVAEDVEADVPEDSETDNLEVGTESSYEAGGPDGSTEGYAGDLDGAGPPVDDTPAELSTGPASDHTVEELLAAVDEDEIAHFMEEFPMPADGEGLGLQMVGTGGLAASSNYLTSTGTAAAVGVVISYRNGTLQTTCSGTLVSRNMVLTAAHCLVDKFGVDYTDYLFYPGYHPQKSNNTVWRSVTGYRWPRYNELVRAGSSYKNALDYGLIQLAAEGGSHAGDIYGWWPVWMSPPLSGAYTVGKSISWNERRVLSGYPGEGWYAQRWPTPWVCNTSSGAYYNWGSGYWQLGSGCTSSGGQSGGPIWALRSNRWYIVSVASTLEYTIPCGISNPPISYTCYTAESRFSYGYNIWGPALLGSQSGYSYNRLWAAAHS